MRSSRNKAISSAVQGTLSDSVSKSISRRSGHPGTVFRSRSMISSMSSICRISPRHRFKMDMLTFMIGSSNESVIKQSSTRALNLSGNSAAKHVICHELAYNTGSTMCSSK